LFRGCADRNLFLTPHPQFLQVRRRDGERVPFPRALRRGRSGERTMRHDVGASSRRSATGERSFKAEPQSPPRKLLYRRSGLSRALILVTSRWRSHRSYGGHAAARTESALQAHASYRTVAVDHAETEPARRRQALPDQLSREDITFDVDDLLSLAERSRRAGRVGAAPLIIGARATSASTSSRHRRSRRAPIDAVN
jgi:hypothetical protein